MGRRRGTVKNAACYAHRVFTGLIQHRGRVIGVEPNEFGAELRIGVGDWTSEWTPAAAVGESIAVDGCCLTLARDVVGGELVFDVIRQTLDVTTIGDLCAGDLVNLERSATPTTLLGGHLVQGHVDGIGSVESVVADDTQRRIRIAPRSDLVECIVERGSIAVDGVSLTVAAIGPSRAPKWFEVALIPTTLAETTLGSVAVDDRVNLETDCMVRAVVHWLRLQHLRGDS
jgi:riboflavin synthase